MYVFVVFYCGLVSKLSRTLVVPVSLCSRTQLCTLHSALWVRVLIYLDQPCKRSASQFNDMRNIHEESGLIELTKKNDHSSEIEPKYVN